MWLCGTDSFMWSVCSAASAPSPVRCALHSYQDWQLPGVASWRPVLACLVQGPWTGLFALSSGPACSLPLQGGLFALSSGPACSLPLQGPVPGVPSGGLHVMAQITEEEGGSSSQDKRKQSGELFALRVGVLPLLWWW